MATIVASRFAVLSVDDDDDNEDENVLSKTKRTPIKKAGVVKPQSVTSTKSESNGKKKKPEKTQSQNFKNATKPTCSGNTVKKKKPPTTEQWEEWKKKDAEFVEENFKGDLSEAMLLSRLDYEEKKNFYEAMKSEDQNKNSGKKNKKSQKVMSLSEFNNLVCKSSKSNSSKSVKTEKTKESEFFNKLDDDIMKEISKEQLPDKKKSKDSNNQESLIIYLYQSYIEKKDREIKELKEEIERLNVQLKNVKTRNTKLCQIIANGEMKDKAEVLMEVERLKTIKDELSSEVANLHTQLEQERSKVRQLTKDNKYKDKNKKHHGNISESQH